MKYFKLEELTYSQTAKAHSIANVPTAEAVKNLTRLVDEVLDPLRERWGVPIRVTSGYRSATLNRKVGGSSTSYHLRGMAADITSRCVFHNVALYTDLRIMHRAGLLPLTECYLKRQGFYIHVAYDPDNINPQPFIEV